MSTHVLASGFDTGLPEELVREVACILEWYGCDQGRLTMDAAARAILAARAWELVQAADEAAHAKRHEESARETGRLLDLAEARRRARECVRCQDHYDVGGRER